MPAPETPIQLSSMFPQAVLISHVISASDSSMFACLEIQLKEHVVSHAPNDITPPPLGVHWIYKGEL